MSLIFKNLANSHNTKLEQYNFKMITSNSLIPYILIFQA